MPKVGLSRPYVARYNHDGAGKVTYLGGVRAGRAVEYSLTVEAGTSNAFYADNAQAENASGTFSSASLSWTIAELEQAITQLILGLSTTEVTVGDTTVKALVYDDDMHSPYLGAGVIVKEVVRGQTKWRGVVLTKTQFNIPEDAATTQGESIEWQTDTITAQVMRDDTEKHRWQLSAVFDSEAKADAFICSVLGITDAAVDNLSITSAAGTAAGNTVITVTPELTEGRSYVYKTAASVQEPVLYEDLNTWSKWDGASEIAATTGHQIIVAEVDALGLCMAAGSTTVVAAAEETTVSDDETGV